MSVYLNDPAPRTANNATNVAATPVTQGFFFKVHSLPPTTDLTIAGFRTSHSGAGCSICIKSTGKIYLRTHSNSVVSSDSTTTIVAGTWYYFELARYNSTSNGDPYTGRLMLAAGAALLEAALTADDWGESGGWNDFNLGTQSGVAEYADVSVCGSKVFNVQHSDAQCIAEAASIAAVDATNLAFSDALPDVSTLGSWTLGGAGTATTDADNPSFGGGAAPDFPDRGQPRGIGRGLGSGLLNAMSDGLEFVNGLWRPKRRLLIPVGITLQGA